MVTEEENPDSKHFHTETFLNLLLDFLGDFAVVLVDCLVRFRHVPNGRAEFYDCPK